MRKEPIMKQNVLKIFGLYDTSMLYQIKIPNQPIQLKFGTMVHNGHRSYDI